MLGVRRSVLVGRQAEALLCEAGLPDDESGIRGFLDVAIYHDGRSNGLESLEELMEQAIRELPQSEEPLSRLLIEIYENQNLPVGYSAW